MCARLHREARF